MLRRCLPVLVLAPLAFVFAGCESMTDPSSAPIAATTDRAPSARDAELDARLLVPGAEEDHPQFADSRESPESGAIETIAGAEMDATAAMACRWFPALDHLFRCSRNGGLTTYIACAMVSWAHYCDDIDFTDFLEGVGEASDAFGGGGGGAY